MQSLNVQDTVTATNSCLHAWHLHLRMLSDSVCRLASYRLTGL